MFHQGRGPATMCFDIDRHDTWQFTDLGPEEPTNPPVENLYETTQKSDVSGI
jgi:hypothetical protein